MNIVTEKTYGYVLAESEKFSQILHNLEQNFVVEEKDSQMVKESYFDTFDWNLFSRDIILLRQGSRLHLHGRIKMQCADKAVVRIPHFFHWDLSDDSFREALKPLADIRALCQIVHITGVRHHYDVLNKDRKTVLRIFKEELTVRANEDDPRSVSLHLLLRIHPIRGYEKPYRKVMSSLSGDDLELLPNRRAYLKFLLATLGRKPMDYSSKFNLSLPQDVTLHSAVNSICTHLLKAMDTNLPGVLSDIDSEFLHDFRIAVRRTRSLMSQMKKRLPEKLVVFQDEFKWLGSITGPVRDIDVYLLMRDDYRAMIPETLHDGLDAFFSDLEAGRKEHFEIMSLGLTSDRYINLRDQWSAFLHQEDGTEWHHEAEPCRPYARKMIKKRLDRILKAGGAIDSGSPDEDLHRLRIQGKKLRYMLEFYRSFFAVDDIEFFLKQLKKLQNNLGDFNDISVQLDMLSTAGNTLTGRGKRSVAIARAIGGLVTHLNGEHGKVREKFGKTFRAFSCDENIQRLTIMLK